MADQSYRLLKLEQDVMHLKKQLIVKDEEKHRTWCDLQEQLLAELRETSEKVATLELVVNDDHERLIRMEELATGDHDRLCRLEQKLEWIVQKLSEPKP
ncbi:hypothetical protein [Endozoicomonas sp. ALB091]|uniref:hypothetical protein n=1 Tax=Endozoicomonas sp. ALB091 TaxID=3403073 RepID=UPI003BB7C07E